MNKPDLLPEPPAPAGAQPLWAPAGLMAHRGNGTSEDCRKCCLSDTDECETAKCAGPGTYWSNNRHPSGHPVFFTRAA